jgi:hypothetical protein
MKGVKTMKERMINEDMAFSLEDCILMYNAGLEAIIEDGEITGFELSQEKYKAC